MQRVTLKAPLLVHNDSTIRTLCDVNSRDSVMDLCIRLQVRNAKHINGESAETKHDTTIRKLGDISSWQVKPIRNECIIDSIAPFAVTSSISRATLSPSTFYIVIDTNELELYNCTIEYVHISLCSMELVRIIRDALSEKWDLRQGCSSPR
jgi:hypothetical protein